MCLWILYVYCVDGVSRDLKPENVLLGEDGHVRLTDYGLSKMGLHDDDDTATTREWCCDAVTPRRDTGSRL